MSDSFRCKAAQPWPAGQVAAFSCKWPSSMLVQGVSQDRLHLHVRRESDRCAAACTALAAAEVLTSTC